MISIEQIEGEISALEEEKPTHVIMEKLANLYIVRDHMTIKPELAPDTAYVPLQRSKSEFVTVCSGQDIEAVLEALDGHMSAIKILYPKEYNKIIDKIKKI